jgi:hypothetical protein
MNPLMLALMAGGGSGGAQATSGGMSPLASAMMGYDPQTLLRLQMGQQAMQNSVDASPAYPAQALARVLGGVIGHYTYGSALSDLQKAMMGDSATQSGQTGVTAPVGGSSSPSSNGSNSAPSIQNEQGQQQPQQTSTPQQMAGGDSFTIPGMTRQQSMLLMMSDQGAWAKAFADAHGFTPEMKNALYASGNDPETARQLVNAEVSKAGTLETRPGMTLIPPNGTPFTAPMGGPQGSQTTWGPSGPQMSMVPGSTGAIAQSAYAEKAPGAALNVWEAEHTPKTITPGSGEVFATPSGRMAMPPGLGPQGQQQPQASAAQPSRLPAPSVNLIDPSQPNYTGPAKPGAVVPKGRVQPQQGAPLQQPNLGSTVGIPTSRLAMSPQGLNWMKSEGPAQLEEVKNTAEAAQDAHYQLQNLQSELGQLGTQGFLAPGKNADLRVGIAKWVNTAARTAGVTPPDWASNDKIAAAEGALKTGGRLGFALSRSLGAREAAQIVQQAISLNPGILNTPQGNALVTRSMDAVAQRQADRNVFFTQWMGKYGNTFNADVAFNQTHPIGSYVGLSVMPDEARARLKANPGEAHFVDQTFGAGTADRVLNEPW